MVKFRGVQKFSGSFSASLKTSMLHWKDIRVYTPECNPENRLEEKDKMIMKSQVWKRISALAALAVLMLANLASGQTARAQAAPISGEIKSDNGSTLVGTWSVKVQLYDCQTEAPIGNPFASLLTFNEGGTMAGSTTNPGFAVAQRGPDQGIWSREGRGTYRASSVAFLYFTTPPNPPFNPGFQAGTQTLKQAIEFNHGPDDFTSYATTEFFDVAGQSYRQGCASAVAQRLK
jgi:hypothetical protein